MSPTHLLAPHEVETGKAYMAPDVRGGAIETRDINLVSDARSILIVYLSRTHTPDELKRAAQPEVSVLHISASAIGKRLGINDNQALIDLFTQAAYLSACRVFKQDFSIVVDRESRAAQINYPLAENLDPDHRKPDPDAIVGNFVRDLVKRMARRQKLTL